MKFLKVLFAISLTLFLVPAIGAPAAAVTLGAGAALNHYIKKSGLTGYAFDLINPASIEFDGDMVMSIADTVFDNIFINPKITQLHVIENDIVARKQIVFMGILQKLTKKDAGCGSTPSVNTVPQSQKFWNPIPVEFWLAECATNLDATFFVWASQKGYKKYDLTDGEFAEFIIERMETALAEDMLRIAWFNDTAAANYNSSPAGVITNGTDLTDYNIIDGFFKQMFAVVAGDATKRVTIANNANATYATQNFQPADITNRVAHGIFANMTNGSDYRLSETEGLGLYILCTKSVYNQYRLELQSYSAIQASYELVVDGKLMKVLTYNNIPVIPFSFWDRTIKADFNNGTKCYLPHRAVLTIKENLAIGVDAMDAASSFDQFFLPKEKTTNWRGNYKVDAKELKDYMLMIAY